MNEEKKEPGGNFEEIHKERMGLLKAIQHHFSSEPIVLKDTAITYPQPPSPSSAVTKSSALSSLTASEAAYLESLLKTKNVEHLRCARRRLADLNIFVPHSTELVDVSTVKTVCQPTEKQGDQELRRNTHLQQHLFRLHEVTNHRPSTLIRRLSMQDLERENSIVDDGDDDDAEEKAKDNKGSPRRSIALDLNSLNDVTSWLDGNQGVEVDNDGNPLPPPTNAAFRILGTTADDVSCHPHVLSPPLMEALLEFMPETLSSDYHFWLKYSMVRDGAGLFPLVKHVRASQYTVLAIETTEGHVFGAFTLHPWRLSNQFYGSSDSFLWRLRNSRMTPAVTTPSAHQHYPTSLLQQAQMETELDVFPVSNRHSGSGIQGCHLQHGLALGKSHLLADFDDDGTPIMSSSPTSNYALFLQPDLRVGHTSASEAFNNPCLIIGHDGDSSSSSVDSNSSHVHLAQAFFEVANVEVWTLTPFETVGEAEQAELSSFFLQDEERPLNFLSILVNGRDNRVA